MVQGLGPSNNDGRNHLGFCHKEQILFNLRLLRAELEDFSMKDGFDQLVIDAVTAAAIVRDDPLVDVYAQAVLDQFVGARDSNDG